MKKLFFSAAILFLLSFLALVKLEVIGDYTNVKPIMASLHEIYEKKLQVPFFTGFITLGSFLLTLKTFVIVKLKESLYDSKKYTKIMEKQRLLDSKLPYYDPLKNLATFLVYAVIMSISTAASQMTLGFLPFNWAAAFCISLALTTLYLVLIAWWNIKKNLSDLFDAWEKDKRPEDETSAAGLSPGIQG